MYLLSIAIVEKKKWVGGFSKMLRNFQSGSWQMLMSTYKVGGWGEKRPKTCLRNIWMVPNKSIPFEKNVLQPFTQETSSRPIAWSSRRHFIVLLISVHQKALVGNWCRIYGIIFKLEGVMEFSLCSYLDGRGHFKAHSSNSRRNGTERRDLGLLHVYVHWLTSMYPHNGCRVFSLDAQNYTKSLVNPSFFSRKK